MNTEKETAMQIPKQEINKRIKHVVALSKEMPFYARKYKELGINPDEIKTSQDLLKAYEKGLYTTPQDLPELVYYKHPNAKGPFYTSGTTGKPKEIWLNPDDEKWIIAQFSKCFDITVRKNDRVLNCLPKEPAISGHMTNITLSFLKRNFLHFPAQKIREDIQDFLKKWESFGPTHIMSLTTFAYRLPLLLDYVGNRNVLTSIKQVSVGAEPSSVSRRRSIGEDFGGADVYDLYASSENGMIAYEMEPFTDKHLVSHPELLLFLVKNGSEVSLGEVGNVILTNLHEFSAQPYMVLLNYEIGDWAKCIEKDEESGVVTIISEIRRETAYLAGAKLNPQEVEAIIDGLGDVKGFLTGEYCIITYNDADRKAVAEVRLEARKQLSNEQRERISQQVRQKIYSVNFPVMDICENVKDAKLIINITEPGSLYKGYEQHVKPGKPKRLITL